MYQLRLFVAEKLLYWALRIMPKGRERQVYAELMQDYWFSCGPTLSGPDAGKRRGLEETDS